MVKPFLDRFLSQEAHVSAEAAPTERGDGESATEWVFAGYFLRPFAQGKDFSVFQQKSGGDSR